MGAELVAPLVEFAVEVVFALVPEGRAVPATEDTEDKAEDTAEDTAELKELPVATTPATTVVAVAEVDTPVGIVVAALASVGSAVRVDR